MKLVIEFCFKFILLFTFAFETTLHAQSTNPYPYCYPAAVNMTGGTCTGTGGANGFGYRIQSIGVQYPYNSNAGSRFTNSCYGNSNNDVYRYWNDTLKMMKGIANTISVATPVSKGNDTVSIGIWIDFNLDSTFSSNEFVGSQLSRLYSTIREGEITFTPPCNISVPVTRIRIRIQNTNSVSSNDMCSSPTGYGETWDMNVRFLDAKAPVSCINITSDELYAFVPVTFSQCANNYYQTYEWRDINNNKTLKNSENFSATYSSFGQKCVSLKTENCIGKDSVTKCFQIDTVTKAPEIDFITCQNTLEEYGSIIFYKYNKSLIKSKGITSYKWDIYDSSEFYINGTVKTIGNNNVNIINGNVNSDYIDFNFNTNGTYTVSLTAENPKGKTTVIKKDYIRYYPFYYNEHNFNFYYSTPPRNMGQFSNQRWYDTTYSYLNNQNNIYKIKSENFQPFNFRFNQIKMADVNDSLIIYDDSTVNPNKIIARIGIGNNNTNPVFRSSNGFACVRFTTNSSGVAKGIKMNYFTDGNELTGSQNFKVGHSSDPTSHFETKFFNVNQNFYSFNYHKKWYVDGIEQKDFEQKDTLKFIFTDTGKHIVRLEAKGCDSSYLTIDTVDIKPGEGITGYIYSDANNNCSFEKSEARFQHIPVRLYDIANNLLSISYTDEKGFYFFKKDTGTYRIFIDTGKRNITSLTLCHGPDTSIQLTNTRPYAHVDLNLICKNTTDLSVKTIANPGNIRLFVNSIVDIVTGDFDINYKVCGKDTAGGQLIVRLSQNLIFKSALIDAQIPTVNNKTLVYNVTDFSQLNHPGNFAFNVICKYGDTAVIDAEIKGYQTDSDTSNNKKTTYFRVVRSYDPNMKEVFPEIVEENYQDWLDYTIHFQNTGKAPAAHIVLIDTLDTRLNIESFDILSSSHNFNARIDNNILFIDYPGIELPDSFTDSEGSKGYFKFRIKTKNPLQNNEYLDNFVDIYFDDNAPVRTNSARTTCKRNNYIRIPDPQLVIYLNSKYPNCMKGDLMDTTCMPIKQSISEDISGKGVKNIYGLQFFYGLQKFYCNDNQLDSLTYLPKDIQTLICRDNHIRHIPYFPYLDSLNLGVNLLSELPSLNMQMSYLYCDSNQLTQLDNLPSSLVDLNCSNNQIMELPELPLSLLKLDCSNNEIECFSHFSEQFSSLKILGNPNKCLPNYIQAMDTITKQIPICINGDTLNNPEACEGIDISDIDEIPVLNLRVYPNPAQSTLFIESDEDVNFVVLDINGREILSGRISAESSEEISIASLKPGIYILKVGHQYLKILKI